MRFARFGVTFRRLAAPDLETVRGWRNSDWVRPHMRHRAHVGPDDQQRWFASLDAHRDWYFVADVRDAPFALFHLKGVDWSRRQAESGGFVGDPRFLGRPEPAQATLALMDFAFVLLSLDALIAHYTPALPRIVRFNRQLGYRVHRHEPDGFVRASVTASRYFASAARFRAAALTLYGAGAAVTTDARLDARLARRPPRPRDDFRLEYLARSN